MYSVVHMSDILASWDTLSEELSRAAFTKVAPKGMLPN